MVAMGLRRWCYGVAVGLCGVIHVRLGIATWLLWKCGGAVIHMRVVPLLSVRMRVDPTAARWHGEVIHMRVDPTSCGSHICQVAQGRPC